MSTIWSSEMHSAFAFLHGGSWKKSPTVSTGMPPNGFLLPLICSVHICKKVFGDCGNFINKKHLHVRERSWFHPKFPRPWRAVSTLKVARFWTYSFEWYQSQCWHRCVNLFIYTWESSDNFGCFIGDAFAQMWFSVPALLVTKSPPFTSFKHQSL